MKHKKSIPSLLQQFIKPRKDEVKEHALLLAFQRGIAGKDHYDALIRMVNNILMIGLMQQDDQTVKQGNTIKAFVTEIYNRYQAKNSFVLNADLLATLSDLVNQYDSFIKEQHPSVIKRAKVELALFENEIAEKRLREVA